MASIVRQSESAVQTESGKPKSCTNDRQDDDAQKAVQAEGRKSKSCANKRQDTDVQKQCNADNTPNPSTTPNPMVKGKNNNDNKDFFLEPVINDNQSFLS